MYDCTTFCLGPGCEFWGDCEKSHDKTATSPQPADTK